MANLNKVMLIGNLTRDPELRYTPKGSAVTDVGIAVNRTYRVEEETREETTFVDVTFWGRKAEVINQYLKKGRPIFVEGRLQLDTWDDKATGQKRSKLRVVGENFEFLGSRGDDAGGGSPGSASRSHDSGDGPDEPRESGGGGGNVQENDGAQFEEDDDIPF
ncbi:single-stranded DNA-binding protein [soil metagenome]